MRFELSDTQQAIKSAAREFFSLECPVTEVRRVMDTDTAFDHTLWSRCAAQGWTGILFPEEYDGVGLGMVDMAAAWEEMGRALVPGPFVSTVLLAGTLLHRLGTDAQKRQHLAAICRGEAKATLALVEASGSWRVDDVQVEAKAEAGGYCLNGEKRFVADAAIADLMIVAARIDGELALLIVPGGATGVRRTATPGLDLTRRLYQVAFDNVVVPADHLLARGDRARQGLEAALDVATVGVAAEMVGGMQQLLDSTVRYAKTREQFGKPIGAFQAVQHQLTDMLVWLEGARSSTYYAAWALSQDEPQAPVAVSVAKSYAGEAYREAGNRSIQVQGGMGFTWENDAHLYYRRARASELAFGDAAYHRERIARHLVGPAR